MSLPSTQHKAFLCTLTLTLCLCHSACEQSSWDALEPSPPISPCESYMQAIVPDTPCAPASEATNNLVKAAFMGDTLALQQALQAGANINAYADNGRTALMAAAYAGNAACLKILLKAGAKTELYALSGLIKEEEPRNPNIICIYPDFKELELRTALLYAAYKEKRDCLQLLLQAGANANAISRPFYEETALMNCAEAGDEEAVRLLLAHDAKVELKDQYGNSTLIRACSPSKGAGCVQQLIRAGAQVNERNESSQESPFSRACESGNADILRLLLQHEATVHENPLWNQSLLMRAAANKSLDCCQLLLKQGLDVNARNKSGMTALMYACWFPKGASNIPLIKALLQAGADINAQDNEGMTALMFAVRYEHEPKEKSILAELLRLGAEPNIRDQDGRQALDIAINRKIDDEAAILRPYTDTASAR